MLINRVRDLIKVQHGNSYEDLGMDQEFSELVCEKLVGNGKELKMH